MVTSATTRIEDITLRPDFAKMTLQEIGDEVGVTRERVRQILAEIGVRPRGLYDPALPKAAKRTNDWLRQKPNDVLIAALKETGSYAALGRLWGVGAKAISNQLHRRGLKRTEILAPTFEELAMLLERKRAYARERARWFKEHRPKAYRAWSRRHSIKANTALREAHKTMPGYCPTCGYKIRERKDAVV